jgi:hypothetical protein
MSAAPETPLTEDERATPGNAECLGRAGRLRPDSAGPVHDALIALARLLGRQAAIEAIAGPSVNPHMKDAS